MQRMEGVDAGYLYMETPTMHMHTLKIALVEPAESFDPTYFTEVVLERLKDLPAFGRRALKVPFGLNHPLWIADRPIDPARHVFVHRVPEPGGMAGLEDLIGEIGSRPLDQSLPLWEVHVTEPYDGGAGRRRREDAPRAGRRRSGQRPAGRGHRRRARGDRRAGSAGARAHALAARPGADGAAGRARAGALAAGAAVHDRARDRRGAQAPSGFAASRCRGRSWTRRARRSTPRSPHVATSPRRACRSTRCERSARRTESPSTTWCSRSSPGPCAAGSTSTASIPGGACSRVSPSARTLPASPRSGWAATGSRTSSPRWPPTSTTPRNGCG